MLSCIVDVIFLQRQIAPTDAGGKSGKGLTGKRQDVPSPTNPPQRLCQAHSLTYLGELSVAKTATKSGAKRCSTKNVKKAASKCASGSEVTIDRRRASTRREEVAEVGEEIAAPKLERREKVNRRRQIDPTTCERDYTETEVEFMNALDEYKRKSGRMFPTCSEVLEVIHSLGYVKLTSAQMTSVQATSPVAASAKPMVGDLQATAEIETLIAAAKELV
jgi:hypothetical protein